jgi:hypothetical protein
MKRLIPLDDCDVVQVNFREIRLDLVRLPALPLVRTVADGELNSAFVFHVSFGIPPRELECQMIQGGTQIVDDVSKYDTRSPQMTGPVGHETDVDDLLAELGVESHADSWAIALDRSKLADVGIEGILVFFRPLDFVPTTEKRDLSHDAASPPLTPPRLRRLPCDLAALLGSHGIEPTLAATATKRHSVRVLTCLLTRHAPSIARA